MKKIASLLLLLISILPLSYLNAQTYSGYTLYSKMGNTNTYLINMSGSIYHSWSSSVQTGYDCYLLPGGYLLRACSYNGNVLQGAAMCGMVQKLDWNGNVVWQYIYSTSSCCSHHDIHPMPNGNVLIIAYEVKSASEVQAAGCSQNITMWPDKIVEVQPSGTSGGTVVWEWHAWDHLCQSYNSSKNNYVTSISAHPELLNINYNTQKDWMHTNGIDYNATLDQIVFSSHNLNEIYVIDHSTTTAQAATHTGGNSGKGGDILYRWGNPAAYQLGSSSTQVFNVVHDAHWVPAGCPKANYLVGFNNKGISGNQSCVDMINPPYDGYTYAWTTGSSYPPATWNWRHICLGSAQDQSNSQQLPNGNMLVCISSTGYMYEIDSLQNLLWSYTAGGSVAKAFRYTDCYINGGLTVTAAASPSTGCAGTSVQLNATASGGSSYTYSWTSVPAGFTSSGQNPVATPATSTLYIVAISENGCQASDSAAVTVDPLPPTPVITRTGDSLASSSSTGNQWHRDGGIISGATGQYLVISQPATYTVQVTSPEGCLSVMSDPYIFVGIDETANGNSLTVYPNPTTGTVRIDVSGLSGRSFEIRIYNSMGRIVVSSRNRYTADLSGLQTGFYYLTIFTDNAAYPAKKIVLVK